MRGEVFGLPKTCLSSNRWSPEDLQDMAVLHDTGEYGKAALRELRAKAMTAPKPPDDKQMELLQSMRVSLAGYSNPAQPRWLNQICRARDWFRGTILVINRGTTNERSYSFLFGCQQPMIACFAKLERLPVVIPSVKRFQVHSLCHFMHVLDAVWPWQFNKELSEPTYGYQLHGVTEDEVWVLRLVEHISSSMLASPADPVPLEEFLRYLPDPPRNERDEQGEGSGGAGSSGDHRIYWTSTGEPAAKKPRDDTADEPDNYEELTMVEADALREWLAGKKVEMHEERGAASKYFVASFRGSSWTAAKKGIGSDCAVANAASYEVGVWAKRVFGNQMSSFSLAKYGERLASALACLWADRMEFFYNAHLEGRLVPGPPFQELRGEAPKATLVNGILADLPGAHPGHNRLAKVLELEPRA